LPLCSAIVVTYNGRKHLDACLSSLLNLEYPYLEIIVIDNGSSDDSVAYLREHFPQIQVYEHENNFAAAIQFGIEQSEGEFVAFVNNDAQLDHQWLHLLVDHLQHNAHVGGAAGKIRFPDGRIDSVGHQRLPDHYWSDRGIGEIDRGQYDHLEVVDGICWAAALFRRSCLETVGKIDRDFVMYFEDVDYATRCRQQGWELHYVPRAIAIHEGGGSSQGSQLTDYFCNRNRFLYLAKHEPEQLLNAIQTSGFLIRQRWDWLLEAMAMTWHKLFQHQPISIIEKILPDLIQTTIQYCGNAGVQRILKRLEVIQSDRPLTIGIYDHALHTIGGGQRYIATLAATLQDQFSITFLTNKPVTLAQIEAWYGLDLSQCQLEVIPLPFFDQQNAAVDGTWVTPEMAENPFDLVSEKSREFDIFINANQLTKVKPQSPISIFFCHFPDSWRDVHFAADRYTLIITSGQYAQRWIRKLWNLEPTLCLYPPIETPSLEFHSSEAFTQFIAQRDRLILSVARFDTGGNKKQLELIQAFQKLRQIYPELCQDWQLILVGGSSENSAYLQRLQIEVAQDSAIQIQVNLPLEDITKLYRQASFFWHLCGLDEFQPERVEHFGMVTVEAMQQGCIPIVFDGGGQREIVEAGISGERVQTIEELVAKTAALMTQPERRFEMAKQAIQRGQRFSRSRFETRVEDLFTLLEQTYRQLELPDPGKIYQQCRE